MNDKNLINISKRTFLSVCILLLSLIIVSIILTYIIPRGEFGVITSTNETDYSSYHVLENEKGIAIWKGLLAPFFVLGTSDGISLIMLSIFLLVITGTFQAMNDNNGIKVIVKRIIEKFKKRKFLLLSIITLVFMLFGSLLGLFEEMLTLLPIMVILAISIGYDSFTGFLVSIVACGFGFSSAITNPFTVLFASKIIDVNPLTNVYFRIIIFVVMYGLMEIALFLYTRKVERNPEKSYTYDHDIEFKKNVFDQNEEEIKNEKKIFFSYIILFAIVLGTIITFSVIDALRDYTVVGLIVVFLFGGILTSLICTDFNFSKTMKSFGSGVLSAIPSIAFILLASSIKYILVEGKILPTIINVINDIAANKNKFVLALLIFGIIIILEFFISSSTAKAVFVMSILGVLSLGLTKEMLVLIYTLGDGYTNLLFPTSPVLLIGLSMIGFSYFKWLKKSWYIFIVTFILVIGFIWLGLVINF